MLITGLLPRITHFAFLIVLLLAAFQTAAADKDWPTVGGDKGFSRYSTLDQINARNVQNLQLAWTYHTGDAGKSTTIECTPIMVKNVLFLTTPASKVVALDA